MKPTTSAITLCADDYGLTPGLGIAIRDLIGQGRLHATGCMTGGPHWAAEARLLKPLADRADVGLHLTLTDQPTLGAMPSLAPHGRLPPLGKLLQRAMTHRLDRAEITAELTRQYDAFEAALGRAPDFLDGHHHIHQLPVIRDVVLDLWKRRMGGKGWVRSCWDPHSAIQRRGISPLRAHVIAALGWKFRRLLAHHKVPHNQSFRGVYDFSGKIPFGRLFETFTHSPGPLCLMMVHPGVVDDALRAADCLTDQRETEYHFLASPECAASLAEWGIALTRLFAHS